MFLPFYNCLVIGCFCSCFFRNSVLLYLLVHYNLQEAGNDHENTNVCFNAQTGKRSIFSPRTVIHVVIPEPELILNFWKFVCSLALCEYCIMVCQLYFELLRNFEKKFSQLCSLWYLLWIIKRHFITSLKMAARARIHCSWFSIEIVLQLIGKVLWIAENIQHKVKSTWYRMVSIQNLMKYLFRMQYQKIFR